MRISLADDHDAIMKMVEGWMKEAGEGCTLSMVDKNPKFPTTSTDPSDPWWKAFSSACERK